MTHYVLPKNVKSSLIIEVKKLQFDGFKVTFLKVGVNLNTWILVRIQQHLIAV
jgi:hypothetical protein